MTLDFRFLIFDFGLRVTTETRRHAGRIISHRTPLGLAPAYTGGASKSEQKKHRKILWNSVRFCVLCSGRFLWPDVKKRLLFSVFSLCLSVFVFLAGSSEAAFRDNFLGARSVAMGGAYTALADDVDGALVNPAGLSMIKGQQIVATMAALYVGLSDDSFISQNIAGYAYQFSGRPKRPLQARGTRRRESRVAEYEEGGIGTLGIVWKRFGAGSLYSENVLALSFARALRAVGKVASFGATLKLMSWDSAPTIGAHGKVVEDLPGWRGISFDVGFVVWPSENIPVAVALQNVNRPDITSNFSKVEEKLPSAVRVGVAAIGEDVTWVMDMILRDGQLDLRMGLERRAYEGNLLFRTGFGLENLAWGTNFTLGAGYKISDSTRIDYAFVYPVNTILDTLGSHRVSVVYDF